MEEPVSLEAEDIRDEKVKVLKKIDPLNLKDVVFGQYVGKDKIPGYLEESDVPNNSITPTYGSTILFIKNRRWDGVPFFLVSGKALKDTKTEIKINFKKIPGKLFDIKGREMPSNKLVIRVQPNESIHFDIMNKIPGLELKMERSSLNLQYHSAFNEEIPDAYERLILDVIKGDKSLFIRDDELDAAWKIFTPMLNEMESNNIRPEDYEIGTDGPAEANYLAAKHGIRID